MCFHVNLLLVLLFLLVVLDGGLSSQPCLHYEQYTAANCSDRGLNAVPWGLHHNIETLDLSNNKFSKLAENAFRSYANLRILRLRNNTLSSIHRNAFINLPKLQILDLAYNQLSNVPTDIIQNISSLLSLNLAGNNLMIIPGESFQGLENLKFLDLSGNRIGDIEPNGLYGLSKLQVLKLENNALRSLYHDTIEHLSSSLQTIHLYSNPWVCDCKVRWLREWMANGTEDIWQQPNKPIVCDGPSINRGRAVATIPLDELACKVEMRTSGTTQYVNKGNEAVMECIYFSIPVANPIWDCNGLPINFEDSNGKYATTKEGAPLTTTRLYVRDFQYSDIKEYECTARNMGGTDSTKFKVTLKGVPFESVAQTPRKGQASAGVDTKSIVIGVAVVCGIILIGVLSVLVYCCISQLRRKNKERRDAVVENVKKHFLENGEAPEIRSTEIETKAKLEQFNDDTNSESTRTNYTNPAQVKRPIENEYNRPKEGEPFYTFQQPSSPFANGNTYVSFGSETDPELLPYPQGNNTSRFDGSVAESTTPLLDRYTPSVFDSEGDPFDDSMSHNHSNIYESATMYHPKRNHFPGANGSVPPLTPGSARSSTRSTNFIPSSSRHPDYQDYRELRYPYNSTPQQRMLGTKKSMSVGNLGHNPPPRKPPRVFHSHSKEYVEMSPHDTSGSTSDYASLPQPAPGPYYGLKPGTPV